MDADGIESRQVGQVEYAEGERNLPLGWRFQEAGFARRWRAAPALQLLFVVRTEVALGLCCRVLGEKIGVGFPVDRLAALRTDTGDIASQVVATVRAQRAGGRSGFQKGTLCNKNGCQKRTCHPHETRQNDQEPGEENRNEENRNNGDS